MAQEFGGARFEHQAKEQPAEEPDARPCGLQEDGEKAGFEQQKVPLIGHEDLAAVHDGKVIDEKDDERALLARGVRTADQRHAGEHRAGPDDRFESAIGVDPPEEGRRLPEPLAAELPGHLCKELGYRLHALFADQSSDLPSERDEGDEIDQGDGAGEEGRGNVVSGPNDLFAPEQARNPVAGVPIRGYDPVQEFHDSGKARQVAIKPEREGPQAAGNQRHQAESCLGAAGANVAVEILNRAAEVGERNVGKPLGGALIREVFDAVAGQ